MIVSDEVLFLGNSARDIRLLTSQAVGKALKEN